MRESLVGGYLGDIRSLDYSSSEIGKDILNPNP